MVFSVVINPGTTQLTRILYWPNSLANVFVNPAIADFAVATGVVLIKTGSICLTDRIAKYNLLLIIEEQLNGNSQYAGKDFIGC